MSGLTDLDLRLLRLFLVIVECRGFAAAQASLNLSLSTISMHMTQLETRLGVRLCERGRGGFRLTAEGRKVYELSQRVVGTLNEVSSEIAGLRNVLIGRLRIGAVDNVANNPAAKIDAAIARFDSRPNEVSIEVEIITPRDLERHVADGLVDLGIGPSLHRQGSLKYQEIFEERQYLYCSYNHGLFEKAPAGWSAGDVTAQKYAGHICPLPENSSQHGLLNTATTGQHMEGVALLILSGRFIGYLPQHYAKEWTSVDLMREILPSRFQYMNQFYCISRNTMTNSKIVKSFINDVLACHHDDQEHPSEGLAKKIA